MVNNKVALMIVMLAMAVGAASASFGAPVPTPALVETEAVAAGTIPVEAEDMEMVNFDAEVDHALAHGASTEEADDIEELQFDHETTPSNAVEAEENFEAIDAEMGVANMESDSNVDLDIGMATPAAAEEDSEHANEFEAIAAAEGIDMDAVFLSEGESLSIAVSDDAEAATESESASAAVDSDEDASFLAEEEEVEAADEAEEEEEEEEESEDESEEEESSEDAAFIIVHEADVAEEPVGPRLSETGVQIVEDSASIAEAVESSSSAVEAEEDVAAEAAHSTEIEMVDVNDFDVAKVKAAEVEEVRTRGSVTAGLADATIEETARADVEAVNGAEVISVVSDADVRAAAGASFLEADAHAAEEQKKLDLMHKLLIALRQEQGRSVDEDMTPEDMDAIEEKMAAMVEVSADTETTAAASAAVAVDAAHPRDHTIVAKFNPTVEAASEGAKLNAVKIVGNEKPVKLKPKYRWDIQYHADKPNRKYMPSRNIELSDKPHPIHARDPTAPSKLKNPVKPGMWDRRSLAAQQPKAPQYRYDVTYEKRTQCCRAREACCIRGVKTKVIGQKKAVRIVKPNDKKAKKAAKKAKKAAAAVTPRKQYRWDVEYERVRASCCSSQKACCRPPANMYAADGDDVTGWVVVARNSAGPFTLPVRADLAAFDSDELEVLQRIQSRQQLLHTLLLTHDSPYYDDDVHVLTSSDAHIVQFHEPQAATARVTGYGRDGDLTLSEFQELQDWLRQLPVVPHLSVMEVSAATHAASGDSFLEIESAPAKVMKAVKVLKGFVDIEQKPTTLSSLLSALPPTPAIAM